MQIPWNTIEELARQASDAKRKGRDDEARRLLGEIFEKQAFLWAAQRVHSARGNPPGLAVEDLEHDLWLHVLRKIDQFDPRGHFAGWLRRVCDCLLLDALRKLEHAPQQMPCGDQFTGSVPDGGNVSADLWAAAREFDANMSGPFSDYDWQRLASWSERNPRTPVTVLIGFGFWRKLHNDPNPQRVAVWRGWLEQSGIADPDAMFGQIEQRCGDEDINGRIEILAGEVDLPYNSAWKDWDRKRHLVVELEFFWNTFLSQFEKFSADQVCMVLDCLVDQRVPILCIDQLWPRANGCREWVEFRANYQFRGTPPLLRFFQLEELDDRIKLFANSIRGDVPENITLLARMLAGQVPLRQALRT